jgi:hypothetical protein
MDQVTRGNALKLVAAGAASAGIAAAAQAQQGSPRDARRTQEAPGQKRDGDMFRLAVGHQVRRGDLRKLYERIGVAFTGDGKAILKSGTGSAIQSIELDEDLLLPPKPADWKAFNDEVTKALGNQVELFNLTDIARVPPRRKPLQEPGPDLEPPTRIAILPPFHPRYPDRATMRRLPCLGSIRKFCRSRM